MQPTRLPRPWDSPGKNTGVGCHFLHHCMKVKSEREVAQSCPTLSDPMDCSLPGSSAHGIFQARVLEWGAITFSVSLHRAFIFSIAIIWNAFSLVLTWLTLYSHLSGLIWLKRPPLRVHPDHCHSLSHHAILTDHFLFFKYICIVYFIPSRAAGEGNSNPLQYSCLENPMDRGAWWAAVHGVTKSQTRLSD